MHGMCHARLQVQHNVLILAHIKPTDHEPLCITQFALLNVLHVAHPLVAQPKERSVEAHTNPNAMIHSYENPKWVSLLKCSSSC